MLPGTILVSRPESSRKFRNSSLYDPSIKLSEGGGRSNHFTIDRGAPSFFLDPPSGVNAQVQICTTIWGTFGLYKAAIDPKWVSESSILFVLIYS